MPFHTKMKPICILLSIETIKPFKELGASHRSMKRFRDRGAFFLSRSVQLAPHRPPPPLITTPPPQGGPSFLSSCAPPLPACPPPPGGPSFLPSARLASYAGVSQLSRPLACSTPPTLSRPCTLCLRRPIAIVRGALLVASSAFNEPSIKMKTKTTARPAHTRRATPTHKGAALDAPAPPAKSTQ